MEGLNKTLQLGSAANLGEDSEESSSSDEIERLREINKSDVEGNLPFSALLVVLTEGKDDVYR